MKSKFSDLTVGCTIRLTYSKETFVIDKIFDDGFVDMTATEKHPTIDFYQSFYSIKLTDFEIIKK